MKALKKRLRAINESRAQKRKVLVPSVLFWCIFFGVGVSKKLILILCQTRKMLMKFVPFSTGWPSLWSSSFWIPVDKVWSLPRAKAL
jgi:hypothetical protein